MCNMILLILCFVPRVLSDLSTKNVLLPRKSKPNIEPFEMAYVDSKINDSHMNSSKYNNIKIELDYPPRKVQLNQSTLYPDIRHKVLSERDVKIAIPNNLVSIDKSNSKYNSRFLPSKLKTDHMYEHLKSAMHYKPPFKTETLFGYETEFHIDDDDVRTSTRELYDSWPYYHYNPYEYEHMRIEAEREKAKDKRYAVDMAKVIPIHEDLSHDIPYSQEPVLTTTEYHYTTTDNPMSGHEPFFSFMLNDYFNKNYDYQDELTLKGIDWNKDFDNGMSNQYKENYAIRNRRLPNNLNRYDNQNNNFRINEAGSSVKSESATEKGKSDQREFSKHEGGNSNNMNEHSNYNKNTVQNTGFKDFVDNFANKFGSEDHKKDSKYLLKRNQDRGENRKGFRRVYHKDEYQEDNEFYDNNNSSVRAEDKGSSNVHIGGSEGLLKSTAYANMGHEGNSANKFGNTNNNMFENNLSGYNKNKEYNTNFHKYRDVAKQAAESNNADYISH